MQGLHKVRAIVGLILFIPLRLASKKMVGSRPYGEDPSMNSCDSLKPILFLKNVRLKEPSDEIRQVE